MINKLVHQLGTAIGTKVTGVAFGYPQLDSFGYNK